MGVLKGIIGAISLVTVYPIWFYLIYRIMGAAEVSNSVWMFFSLYVILKVILGILMIIAMIVEDDQ